MYKQNIEVAGVSYPRDLKSNSILHIINMHGLTKLHTVTDRLHGHCHLPCVQLKLLH